MLRILNSNPAHTFRIIVPLHVHYLIIISLICRIQVIDACGTSTFKIDQFLDNSEIPVRLDQADETGDEREDEKEDEQPSDAQA